MRLIIIFLNLVLFLSSQQLFALDAKSLKRDDGSTINYYLSKHKDQSQNTLFLVLQGSDCNSVAHNKSIMSHFSKILPNADLLLIEKRGITKKLPLLNNENRADCPKEYLTKDSPEQRVSDIRTVLTTLRDNNHYQNFVIVGGSEGATIAYLAAKEIPFITATAAFNGGGQWFYDDVIHNMRSTISDPNQLKGAISGFTKFTENIKNKKPFEVVVSGHGYHWWKQMLTINTLDVISEINSPLLVIQSGSDKAVSPEQVRKMITDLKNKGKENIRYIEYPELDHGFRDSNIASQLDKLVKDISHWLESKIQTKSNE